MFTYVISHEEFKYTSNGNYNHDKRCHPKDERCDGTWIDNRIQNTGEMHKLIITKIRVRTHLGHLMVMILVSVHLFPYQIRNRDIP